MIEVSILYPTHRLGGIDVLVNNIKRQDYDLSKVELIIIDELFDQRSAEVITFVGDSLTQLANIHYMPGPDKKVGTINNLHQSYNVGLSVSLGQQIMVLQDYIWCPEYTISRLLEYSAGKNLVSAVGNKRIHHDPFGSDYQTNLHGKISIWDHLCDHKPDGPMTFTDPRITGANRVRHAFITGEYEANVCMIPREVWVDRLGGVDEILDQGWACDNVDVAARADYLGIPILVAEDVEVIGMEHNVWWPNKIQVPEHYQRNLQRVSHQLISIWRGSLPVKYAYV